MSRTPTQAERAEFLAFCRTATAAQLRNIAAKEADAGRHAYAEIARTEAASRGVSS